jgi:hypothetical protein
MQDLINKMSIPTGHETRSVIPSFPRSLFMDKDSLPTIPINRDEKRRIPKMRKILREWIPTHDEIAIFRVMNDIEVSVDEEFEKIPVTAGWYLGNGNTRREYYSQFPEEAPTTDLVATVYNINSEKDFTRYYYSYDSTDSAETGAQKIQGAIRLLGMNVSSSVAKNGGFRSALDIAHPNPKASVIEKVSFFKDEIQLLDRVGIFSHMDIGLKFQAMYAMCLLAAKYWNSPSDQYDRMVAGLQTLSSAKYEDINLQGDKWDGLTCIQVLYFTNGQMKQWVEPGYLRKTSFATVKPQMDFLLYCFELYMLKQKINKSKGFNSRPQDGLYDTIIEQLQ